MAPRNGAQSTPAEVGLVHLKNCLVNLPPTLVSLLVNVNTPAQNVVVELSYQGPPDGDSDPAHRRRSIFLGWTGMPSKRRTAAPVSREGIRGSRGSTRDQDIQAVEVDATLANTLGISEGQRVTTTVHVDPPLAHTINIEPLTPEDWEIIELHATFLELNLQSQVRALPNPACALSDGTKVPSHPMTLHLSPTSTANIRVTSLEPAPASDVSFVKLSPNAEVIVAPKTRAKTSQGVGDHRSVTSNTRSKRSAASTVRRKSAREERKPVLFARGLDRAACQEWFDDENDIQSLCVWVDREHVATSTFRNMNFVAVEVMRPAGLEKPRPEDGSSPPTLATTKAVAHLRPWDDPPNGQTVALSSPLCAALGCDGMVGGIVKIQATPAPLAQGTVRQVKVFPFASTSKGEEGLKFGGESKAQKEESAKRLRQIYTGSKEVPGLLQGPLTDGLVLNVFPGLDAPQGWSGGIIKFQANDETVVPDSGKDAAQWLAGLAKDIVIDFQAPLPRPTWMADPDPLDTQPSHGSQLVGFDALFQKVHNQLAHLSSVLLTGTMGSGKTAAARHLAAKLRSETLFHTVYFPCRKLVNDETRVSTIKETLNRIFMTASWCARLGGQSLVVLDDLDRLCPAETELQVGNDNGRSRQISELVCSLAKQYCSASSGVVLLATAENKDSLNNVVVGGHVVREILELNAPDKEARRGVMESVLKGDTNPATDMHAPASEASRPTTADGSHDASTTDDWMEGGRDSGPQGPRRGNGGFVLDADLDLLDVAGSTDGYMPGDILVLVSRAKNEAIIRSISSSSSADSETSAVPLAREDFDRALKGFTPASLRNVSLQTSTTTFKSIGGLRETRKVLLETLEYPTKYAPIFAQCPLRLRSGLLLYGYPGCGKTMLASAVAGECGLNFISVKGPEILNKYIGASEKSVRDLFDRAQAARPCVLFFDEFDSIAPKRGHDSTGVTDRVVNQLLTQMDGAEGLSGVYVLAATSRPDLIDPALLRPGRLDKSLLCDLPSVDDRLDILKALFQKVRLSAELTETDEALGEIAQRTHGFSGADLQGLVSNAQLEAIHDVLDVKGAGSTVRQANGTANGAGSGGGKGPRAAPSFVQFRYGENAETDSHRVAQSKSAAGIENAAILGKLEQIRLGRKKEKQAQRGDMAVQRAASQVQEQKEVVIGQAHIVKALESARASISAEERARLERIYREFVVGRSGQMKDGQGSMEIGGRSSLM